jgi:hypothetical protein
MKAILKYHADGRCSIKPSDPATSLLPSYLRISSENIIQKGNKPNDFAIGYSYNINIRVIKKTGVGRIAKLLIRVINQEPEIVTGTYFFDLSTSFITVDNNTSTYSISTS